MIAALAELGVDVPRRSARPSSTPSGAYRDQILLAMRERGRHRRRSSAVPHEEEGRRRRTTTSEAAEGSGAPRGRRHRPASTSRTSPTAAACGRDVTTVTAYDDDTTELTYTCACGSSETVLLSEFTRGKLVWKVDWPMRWAYEGVHLRALGRRPLLARLVVPGRRPDRRRGLRRRGRRSARCTPSSASPAWRRCRSSRGGVPTPADALKIMEAPLLRWLYARRRPNQAFKVAFDQEIQRLYDEWDALGRARSPTGTAPPADDHRRTSGRSTTAARRAAATPRAGAVPDARVGRRHHRGRRRADSAHPRDLDPPTR